MEFGILVIYTSLWTWTFLVLKIARSVSSPSVYQQSEVPSFSKKYGAVLFTETFNLNNWAGYEKFIQSLRDKAQLRYKTSHNLPVLYPEEVRPTNFFDVILSVPTSNEVTLKIRQDNLYLVGYKNASNLWLEFNDFSPNLINESTFLGFNGDYGSLANRAGQDRFGIALGKEQLKQAVIDLATSTEQQRRAKGLTIVIQMISESMRFRNISKFLTTASGNPPTSVVELENSWGHISEELLHRDSDPTHKFVPPNPQTGITNEVEAVEAMGMIKYFKFRQIGGWNMEANTKGEHPQAANPTVEVA